MDTQSPFESDDEVDVFTSDAPVADSGSESGDESEAQPELIFPNLEAFVTEFLIHHYTRPVDPYGRDKEFTWCSSWWAHAEAVNRLNGLWRAWEALRLDETTGMADWWKDYADPTMRALFYSKGTFQGCTVKNHAPSNEPLPVAAAPQGLFSSP